VTVHTVTPILAARDRLPSAVTHGRLEHGLMVCLGLLASDPEGFAPAAVGWHAGLCAWLPGIEFSESQAALAALEGLAGPNRIAAARALRDACRRHGLDDVAAVLDGWLAQLGPPPIAPGAKQGPPQPLTAA